MKKILSIILIIFLLSGCRATVNQAEQEPVLIPNSSYEPYIL